MEVRNYPSFDAKFSLLKKRNLSQDRIKKVENVLARTRG